MVKETRRYTPTTLSRSLRIITPTIAMRSTGAWSSQVKSNQMRRCENEVSVLSQLQSQFQTQNALLEKISAQISSNNTLLKVIAKDTERSRKFLQKICKSNPSQQAAISDTVEEGPEIPKDPVLYDGKDLVTLGNCGRTMNWRRDGCFRRRKANDPVYVRRRPSYGKKL